MRTVTPRSSRQRGGVALAVTLAIAFVLSLLAAAAHHALLAEQRMAANLQRATLAFDAAEAGIDWTIAHLNDAAGGACGSGTGAAASFRERHLGSPDPRGRWHPPASEATCTLQAGAWLCPCAGAASPAPQADAGSPSLQPAFGVQLLDGDRPQVVRLVSVGCTDAAAPCTASDRPGPARDARARITVDLGLLPALAEVPDAALTVRGSLGAASRWTLANRDPAGTGLTVQAGGAAPTSRLVLTSTAGTPGPASIVASDAALSTLAPAHMFARLFRLHPPAWQALPTARRIPCAAPCDVALQQAVANGARQLWLDGGLTLAGPVQLGTTARPVLLIADGPVRLGAAATLTGVVYARSPEWHDAGGTIVHGAVIAEGDLGGTGGSTVHRDAQVLATLHTATGTFARVPGSWRDF